ncbi:MAG: glycogen/starch synthase [Candidatus Limnocylindrales bacterium]|jgi:starch synthase
MRVVFIATECEPWAKTGGLGDVVDALARAVGSDKKAAGEAGRVAAAGGDEAERPGSVEPPVDVFLPRYRGVVVPERATVWPLTIPDPTAASGFCQVSIVEFEDRGYRVRLIDHPPAFDRPGYYGDASGDYADNGWRFGLLCRAAIEALLADRRAVDVLHLHDWQAAPAAVLRDCAYATNPLISRAAVMITIHNLAYQGWLSREAVAGMLFPEELARALPPESDGMLLLREGIRRAELVNTVSPGYAQEILRPAFGMGLDPALAELGDRFGGILNGLDTAVWDPATDAALPECYSRADLAGKAACRRLLLSELGFDPDDAGPVLAMIGRLDPQKGFDLLAGAAPELIADGARLVALGTGDRKLVLELRRREAAHPGSVALVEAFDRVLARRIYAGADLYLMPSRFEPCGQGQMIALRYGTPPVVHRTGGLADTVVDVDEHPSAGTGFVHDAPTIESLVDACRRAMSHYRRGGAEWTALQRRGMAIDWSWEAGLAGQYVAAYRRAVSLRRER